MTNAYDTTQAEISPYASHPVPSRPSSRLQQDSSRISPYNMTQADAYNCAFRSHHLIRFRGCWGSVYMGGRVLEPSFTWGNASWSPRGFPRRLQEGSREFQEASGWLREGSKRVQESSKRLQDGSKRAPGDFRTAPRGLRTVPRGLHRLAVKKKLGAIGVWMASST